MKIFKNDWNELLEAEMNKAYFQELIKFLMVEYENNEIFPSESSIFNALDLTPYEAVKVVILGQDPYHGPGQAHGLSFSVMPNTKIPPSLVNIYKELYADLGLKIPNNGHLEKWSKQGVLLLNTTLTVRQGQPMSHAKMGWERFTDAVISLVGQKTTPVVFILWGNHARAKEHLIDHTKGHLIISSTHPSPLSASRGFFGSRPFSRTNEFLVSKGMEPIDWQIEDI